MIMRQLPDVASLRSLSASSRKWNDLRLHHMSVVLPSVLRNELGDAVLNDALLVVKAWTLESDYTNYRGNLQSFLEAWSDLEYMASLQSTVPLQHYLEIANFQPLLSALVKGFCDYAFSDPTMSSNMPTEVTQTTLSETKRLTRAFFRLQLYLYLYQEPTWVEGGGEGKTFELQRQSYKIFSHWKAWENEEIACVRDYIYFKLAEVFENIRREAAISPIDTVILMPWEEEPEFVEANQVIFYDHLLPSWVDATSPCGADLSPEGKFIAFDFFSSTKY